MALDVYVGSFAAPGVTGNQAITDPGFTPKAIICWAVNMSANGISSAASEDGMFCLGFGTRRSGATQQCYQTSTLNNNTAAMDYSSGTNSTALLKGLTVTATVDFEMDLVSFDANGFTVDWVDLPTTASLRANYIVLGGSDITDANALLYTETATATQDVTVVAGFGQPDLMFFQPGMTTSATDAATDCGWGIGVAKDGAERAASCAANDGPSSGAMGSGHTADAYLAFTTNANTFDHVASMSAKASWPTDGFELTYSVTPSTVRPVICLALKGTFQSAMGTIAIPRTGTPTVNTDFDAGFVPKLGMAFSNCMPASAAVVSTDVSGAEHEFMGIGATDGTRERFAGLGEDDAGANSAPTNALSDAKLFQVYHPVQAGAGTLQAEADGSFTGNNVRLGWTDIDATPTADRVVSVLALGDNPTPPAGSSDSPPRRLPFHLLMR